MSNIQVDFNEVDEKRLSRPGQLKEGLFKVIVSDARQSAHPKTNDLEVTLTLAPLDSNDNPRSPTTRYRLPIPISNPEVSGHTPTDVDRQKKKLRKFIEAVAPGTLPKFPRKQEDGSYVTADGEVMTKAMWTELETTSNRLALQKAKTWFNDPATLNTEVFYAFIKNDGEYANVFWVSSEAGDKEVITESFAA